jgi:hypothetical protein
MLMSVKLISVALKTSVFRGFPKNLHPKMYLAVCCASAQNCIKIHVSEFLYRSNCIRSPDNREFLHEYAKIPQVQQAPRPLQGGLYEA